ncbi:autotransporter outer membrane beta-barrel domain-containing protein [Bartonella tribocorum]|uniref:Autotransporter outer membrane beta-barrel domain-containing protein n=1 Tax=Bartonella tribocorum TaxID=85701 RepID=A0A2M6USU7_9HYPH|nr:autotransporter outer membrane beta-barrel domain-containing protein [Bartonella tribocorum]PIT69280.1 autotransporter outer membrane beta-barrel domain-containing protein [Bartonella tribocorum]
MVNLFKNRFSLFTFTTALLFSTHNVDVFASNTKSQVSSGKNQSSCDANAGFYHCNDGRIYEIKDKVYSLTDQNVNSAHGVAIEASQKRTVIRGENITVKGIVDETKDLEKNNWQYGVKVSEGATVMLTDDSTLSGVLVGVEASRSGSLAMFGGSIDAIKVGAIAKGKAQNSGREQFYSKVRLVNTHISLGEVGVKIEEGGSAGLRGVSISDKGGNGKGAQELSAGYQSDRAAVHAYRSGPVIFVNNDSKKGSIDVTDAHGFLLQGNGDKDYQVVIEDSDITVRGNAVYGMRLEGETASEYQLERKSRVYLTKTRFIVPDSMVIYSSEQKDLTIHLKDTKLFGDLLLKADKGSSLKIHARASALVGQTQVDDSSEVHLDLDNKSQWALLQPRHKNLQDPHYRGVSFISSVDLYNSSIVFEEPKAGTAHAYQTLYIGDGKDTVYVAFGDAWIHLNARLNPHDTSGRQVTDRLLIHGDVKGRTIVNIQGVAGGLKEKNEKAHSVSIIQVYGNAAHDSFQLNGEYVTLDGAPYKYVLRSYGPEATKGAEHVKQRFAQNGGKFWNFRLENEYVQTSADHRQTPMVSKRTPPTYVSFKDIIPAPSADAIPAPSADAIPAPSADAIPAPPADNISKIENVPPSGRGVRAVVPQVPTYLLLPNSLLHVGLMDIRNQNKQLEILRNTSSGMIEGRENPASFLRGYGGSYRYTPDLSPLEYGYGGDLRYYAIEAGVLLQKIENVDSALSFGVMGSYGKLSLEPQDVAQSQKSTFDKWTATVYGGMQHDVGFYVDGLLSYGLFKGDVLTTARGKTTTLKGNPLSMSLRGGQTIATGYKGLVFDPQAQVVYQHLQFDGARDIDNFDIEMSKLDQWMVRIGGRLMKTLAASENDRDVSFYGKIHFAHDFGKERSVRFKDFFQLGAFGSSLEAGLGLNAKLSQKLAFHGDLVYQHKLSKGGFSGISFSGGLRYRF